MAYPERKHFQEIFCQSQFSVTTHEKLCKQLKQLYDKMPADAFLVEFIRCLKIALFPGDKARTVENSLNFASKFIALLIQTKPVISNDSVEDEEDELCPFVLNVLKFLFESHNVERQAIRFRVCQFINKVLNGLGNEACIDDGLCDQISECMMERLQDKAPSVRIQAVLALHRLQDPSDPNCPVMKAYLFHMSTDPNADVRRAVITNIAITSQSVRAIRHRIHDIKDSVRRTAFISLCQIGVQKFTITQRVQLLSDGLKDPSAIVRDCVSKNLLLSWLKFYNGSFLAMLHALDCENSTEISSLVLQALFKSEPIKAVLEELTKLLDESKVIPVKSLSPENVLYWRILYEYLEAHPEISDDRPIDEPLPELLPELSTFCNYIREYFEAQLLIESEHWVRLQNQYILIQLMELCLNFDLSDEMGRANLRNLCLYFLTNNTVSVDLVPVVVRIMVKVVPDVEDRLRALAEAISEVREPMMDQEPKSASASAVTVSLSADELREREFKQASIIVKINELQEEKEYAIRCEDFQRAQLLKEEFEKLQVELKVFTEALECARLPPPPTEVRDSVKDDKALLKCLCIVKEMVQAESVKNLSSTLRSLMQNFVIPCLQDDNSSIIRNMALECLGLFCLLDTALAQENFVMFCFQIANDEVCEIALKITFDLLLHYGLKTFQIPEDNDDTSSKKKLKKKKNLFVTDMHDDEFDTEEEESQETLPNVSSGSSGNTSNLISMLTSLLDSTSVSMRNIAMEGLYKLLHACRITSSALLSRLILMWFSPVTEGDETLRQPLAVFLTLYSTQCPRSQETLEQAFLPTLQTLMHAPVTSPLSQIDQDSVARLFISLTRPGTNKFHSKMSHIHNNMALSICNAVMDCDDSTNIGVLLKSLSYLELSLDDPIYHDELKTLINRAKEVFRTSKEKLFLRYLNKVNQQIESTAKSVSMRTTEVDNTAASSLFEETSPNTTIGVDIQEAPKHKKRVELLHPRMHAILSENELDEEKDGYESEDSPNRPITSSLIIPASPPRSQSSDSEEEDRNSEETSPVSRRRRMTVQKPSEENVFKKPADKLKPARDRASSSKNAAPPPQGRKSVDDKKDQQDSKSGCRGKDTKNCRSKEARNDADESEGQKSTGLSSKRNSRCVSEDTNRELSSKRHINPTEKGATLKTFQNIAASKMVASPPSTPPPKRMKKAERFEKGSPESPPVSAAELKFRLRQKIAKAVEKRKSGGKTTDSASSFLQSPSASKRQDSNISKDKKKCDTKSGSAASSSSGPDADSDSSPNPRLVRKTQPNSLSQPVQKKVETHLRSTRSKANAEASLVASTRSGCLRRADAVSVKPPKQLKRSSRLPSSQSFTSDSNSSPSLSTKRRNVTPSPHQSVSPSERLTPSTLTSSSEVHSDASPSASTMQERRRGRQVRGIEKLHDKSAKTLPTRSTHRSASQSDTEESPQINSVSSSERSQKMSPTYPNTRQSLILSDCLSPVPKSSRGGGSGSPLNASRKGKARKTEDKSTPTRPEKKTTAEDSPLPNSTRRSLRSQVETPSPRTRSGKI